MFYFQTNIYPLKVNNKNTEKCENNDVVLVSLLLT